MHLKPMQRSRYDVDDMDTFVPCHFNDIIISVNTLVVAYEETVKTGPSGSPPINEPFHHTAEELYHETSLITLKEYSHRLTSYTSFFLLLVSRHKSFASNIRPSSEN